MTWSSGFGLLDKQQFWRWSIRYNGIPCQLNLISDQEIPTALVERLEPYYSIIESPSLDKSCPTLQILSKSSSRGFGIVFPTEGFKNVELHSDVPGIMSTNWHGPGFPKYVTTLTQDVEFILWPERRILAIGDLSTRFFRRELIKLFRAIFDAMLTKMGWLKVHFGAVVTKAGGLAFTGPKGAGKTTAMARYLASNISCTYGSNDKCYIRMNDNTVEGLGTPQLIGMRPGTLDCYPTLSKFADHTAGEKSYFAPRVLNNYFSKSIQVLWGTTAIVVPKIEVGTSDLKLSKMDMDTIRIVLNDYVFTFSDASTPNWLVEELLPEVSHMKLELRNRIEPLLASLPWYNLIGDITSDKFDAIVDSLT